MALRKLNVTRLLCLWVLQLSLFVRSTQCVKPEILADYETVISSGDNFTVICQGNTPLTWDWPQTIPDEYSEWTTVETSDVLPRNNGFSHGSRLFLWNLSFPFTGFYTCRPTNLDGEDDELVSKIYLFVRDEEHLSVTDTDLDSILATQYTDAIIPCRPTSPDVRVELINYENEKIENSTYDPKTGFSFYVSHLNLETLYTCIFYREAIQFELPIYLKVMPVTTSLPKPGLKEITGGHTVVGQILVLRCTVRTPVQVTWVWSTPTGSFDGERMRTSDPKKNTSDYMWQDLIVENATLQDKGVYLCNITDNQGHSSVNKIEVKIYDADEHFINLVEENRFYTLSARAGEKSVQWRINVEGHPQPDITWLNNENETIPRGNSDKYLTHFTESETFLKINRIAITDYGYYTVVAQNGYEPTKLTLFLNVTDDPSVAITPTADFFKIGRPGLVVCKSAAHPKPMISWYFKPCMDDSCHFEQLSETKSEERGLQITSYVEIVSSVSGYVKCVANNSIGSDEDIQGYLISDVDDGLNIFGFDDTAYVNEAASRVEVASGENLNMVCGASVYNYTKNISWFRNNTNIDLDKRFRVESDLTKFSHRLVMSLRNVSFVDGGVYSCRVQTNFGNFVFRNITVVISVALHSPVISDTNLKGDKEMSLPNRVDFFCRVWGMPKPTIQWFKDNQLIKSSNRTIYRENKERLVFISTEVGDEGVYKCVTTNKVGSAQKQMTLTFKNNPEARNKWLYALIIGLSLLLIVVVIAMVLKIRAQRKFERELQIAGLANFEKGALENINPELGIDDQAELLPYDKKWEFPIEKLKLGKQLGSGAFGVVMKGEAKGIVDGEETTVVAVKMVKKNAGHAFIKALASELKIMVHLGKHLNVVNLLGACTKNVTKRELLVIVEFCRYGNLQNYLLRHRDAFIDQVDPKTGNIDYTIGQDVLERTYSVSSNRSNPQSPYMKYAALAFSRSTSGGGHIPDDMVDYRGDNYNNGTTAKTDITLVSMSPNSGGEEESVVLSNNSSVQPEWRSNYRGDYKGNVKPICTKDLLAWAFQVCRGMEYLASRRVLHGDLAARNILLSDNNVVKICDFGLAKSMYKNDNYKKKGDGPLPVKWMSIESIRDKMFSTQSDVWSFGIVLWEFFSLARTPYPGMEADERLYNKLLEGYRMESPTYAPRELYKMMLDCWQAKPLSRPSFCKLSERIGSLLEDTVRKHYIDLNDPYLVMNTQRIEEGHSDYLAMVSPPDFESLSSPHNYMNNLPPEEGTPGYLCMKSTNIFSPRAEDERVFDFDVANKNKKDMSPEQGNKNELLPMLSLSSESDGECTSPALPNSFSNPSYHLPPIVEREVGKDIVKCDNNYVNMPQSKHALKENNPFVKLGKDLKEVNYVNSNTRDWENIQL